MLVGHGLECCFYKMIHFYLSKQSAIFIFFYFFIKNKKEFIRGKIGELQVR